MPQAPSMNRRLYIDRLSAGTNKLTHCCSGALPGSASKPTSCIKQVIKANQSGVKDSVNSSAADIGDPCCLASLTRALVRNHGTGSGLGTGVWTMSQNGGVTWTRCIDDDTRDLHNFVNFVKIYERFKLLYGPSPREFPDRSHPIFAVATPILTSIWLATTHPPLPPLQSPLL